MVSTDSALSLRLRQANPYTNDYPFEITIDYKSRGWNPCS